MHSLSGIQPAERHLHRGTDGDRVGVDVGHLAPVAAATVEVDHRADDRGRHRIGQVVDGERGDATGDVGQALDAHVVDGPTAQAHPRRWQVPEPALLTRAGLEAALPSGRPPGRRSTGAFGIGATRRLAAQLAAPRQEPGIGQIIAPTGHEIARRRQAGPTPSGADRLDGVGHPQEGDVRAVGQHHHGDEVAGRSPVQHIGEQEPGMGRPQIARGHELVVHQRLGTDPQRAPGRRQRTVVQAGQDHVVDGLGGQVGALECIVECGADQRSVHLLTEALFPRARSQLARGAPPVEELRGGGPGRDRLGGHRLDARIPEDDGDRPVTSVALVRSAGQPGADVGQDGHGPSAAGQCLGRPQCRHARPDRADEVVAAHPRIQIECGMDGGGVRLVQVGGHRRGEEELLGPFARQWGQRPSCRLDPHRRRVLVVGRDATRTPPGRSAECLADGSPLQSPVREVDPPGDNPCRHSLAFRRGTQSS